MRRLFIYFVFICFAVPGNTQNNICRKSTEGTDFWFGFMESRNYHEHSLKITVTARETTTFQITTGPTEQPFEGIKTVQANNSVTVIIPWELVEAIGSEEIEDKGIHLTSEEPVNVFAFNWSRNSADVAVIYPVNSLGTEYLTMCYTPDIDMINPISGNGRNSEFLVVAAFDDTEIEISPSKVTHKLIPKDSTFTVRLNKGQVFQVQSENNPGTRSGGQGDLTGSFIRSSKPVAVYSGSLSTRIPSGRNYWDHLYEQMPPIHSWGVEYYLVPLKSRQQDRYRIMAAQNNTTVNISGREPLTLNRGEFHEMVANYDDPKRVVANKPVMIAQFSQSYTVDEEFTEGNGDPFMIILSPVNQFRNDVSFVAYESPKLDIENYTGILRYFVNIITAASETENILLNGEVVEEFLPFPEGNYSYAQVEINAGTHHLQNIGKNGGFQAYMYGYGGVESYGYSAGFNFDLLLDLGESAYFKGDTLLLCYGDTLTLVAGAWFDFFLWDNGQITQKRQVTEQGLYFVEASTIEGCRLTDSVFVYVSRPETNLEIEYLEECMPFILEISADDGYEKYVWTDENGDFFSSSGTVTLSQTGQYKVTVFDKFGCMASDSLKLVIYPVPERNFSGPSQVCGQKTASLSVELSGDIDIIDFEGSIEWKTNKASLVITETTNNYANISVSEWGDYEIYYQLRTIDNCEIIDTFQIRFHPQPYADFNLGNDEGCEGYSQRLFFDGIVTDSASFHWNLNGAHFLDTLGKEDYIISVGAFLPNPSVVTLLVDDNGCLSDTIVKTTGAIPNFTMDASDRRGCDELSVGFTGKLLTNDNVEYKWEFHDGQTATESQFTKIYNQPGFYSVSLIVSNQATGCTNAFTIDSMIRVFPTPVADISAQPDFCYPDTAMLNYTHHIDSSIYYWEFEGMHQVGGGNDSVWVRFDNPTGRAKLIIDEYGCVSQPFELQLKRKPLFDFSTATNEGCPPFSTELFAETNDNHVRFEWITDSLPYPEGISSVFFNSEPGSYDIRLFAYSSETGCSDTLIKKDWMTIHPMPEANYRVNYSVAKIETANILFTNRSTGADNYYWDFGDGFYSSDLSPIHTYTTPGEYVPQLIAESIHGCADTFQISVSILPSVIFTPNAFRPSSPIIENRTFMPVSKGVNPFYFNLTIYDRQGQLVFESISPERPWDGNLPNGRPAHMGNYIWIVRFRDVQGNERDQKGQVMLIR